MMRSSPFIRWTALTYQVHPGVWVYRGLAPSYEHEQLRAWLGPALLVSPWVVSGADAAMACRGYVLLDSSVVTVSVVAVMTRTPLMRLEFAAPPSAAPRDVSGGAAPGQHPPSDAWCEPKMAVPPTKEFVLAVGLAPERSNAFFQVLWERGVNMPWNQLETMLRERIVG
ncbi:MAG: hypothetical protein H7Y88_02945 [Phycisphaerales bacterium]|nr:hypothetical protein [Phycisphaerales bacterium]